MPYTYSKKKIAFSIALEIFAFFLLLPQVIIKRFKRGKIESILLVEPFQMGDVLSLTPLIDPLLAKFPSGKIYVLTKPGSGSILDLDSRITKVLKHDFPWSDYGTKDSGWGRLAQSFLNIWKLRHYEFDVGIDTRGDIRSQIIMILIGCRQRIGYKNYLGSNITQLGLLLTKSLTRSKNLHRYLWNMELLELMNINSAGINFPTYKPQAIELKTEFDSSILIHVGGGWKYKRWNNTRWIELIAGIHKTQPLRKIMIIAGPSEEDILASLKKSLPFLNDNQFVITTLSHLITLIINYDMFIGLDSGPMNLAVCLNKKVFALFGPGDSEMWYPLSRGSQWLHRKEKFLCNPCFQTVCSFAGNNCMDQILATSVLKLLKENLE